MILRSVVFVAVCAPVWAMYSLVHDGKDNALPAASAVAWTGVHATLCFAGPLTQARGRSLRRPGRRVRVVRKRVRATRVPTVCVVEAPIGAQPSGKAVPLDPGTWLRVSRAIAGPAGPESDALPPARRAGRRRTLVRFFDGRVTFCGVGGRVFENPKIAASDAPAPPASAS